MTSVITSMILGELNLRCSAASPWMLTAFFLLIVFLWHLWPPPDWLVAVFAGFRKCQLYNRCLCYKCCHTWLQLAWRVCWNVETILDLVLCCHQCTFVPPHLIRLPSGRSWFRFSFLTGAEHNAELRLSTWWTKPLGWSWSHSLKLRAHEHTRIFAKHFGFLEVKFDSNSFEFSDIILPRYYKIIVIFFSLPYYSARMKKCWIYLKIKKKILHLPPY